MSIYETALPWVRQRADEVRTGTNKFGELCALTWGGDTAQSVGLTCRQQAALATVISEWFRYHHCRQPYAMAVLDTEFYEDWRKLRHYPGRRAQAADKWQNWAEQMLHAADKELNNEHV